MLIQSRIALILILSATWSVLTIEASAEKSSKFNFVGTWESRKKFPGNSLRGKKFPLGIAVSQLVIQNNGKWQRKVTFANGFNFKRAGDYRIRGRYITTFSQEGSYVTFEKETAAALGLKHNYRYWARAFVRYQLLNPKRMKLISTQYRCFDEKMGKTIIAYPKVDNGDIFNKVENRINRG